MYNHKEIEEKWQKSWEESELYQAQNDTGKPKKYILIEFPYPSGEGLHMGHLRPYVAGDVCARFFRMQGYEIMYPIGWDAFGLPAENFAIKKGVHPRVSTAKNIANAKRQLKSWGTAFDFHREINTTDPEYYKWTQWIFLQFFKAGLAYEATGLINWCPKDKTGLANEEVIDGKCERCGTTVEKKELRQWYLKITDYAEKLLDGLQTLDWPAKVKTQQANWIGRSEGASIKFLISNVESLKEVEVFTTRPDTIFGVTFLVISPELAQDWIIDGWQASEQVRNYIGSALSQEEQDRVAAGKEKTGVDTGIQAINPATQEKILVFVADYVLGGYGTGAIMAVPAHDERDFAFAKKYNLPIKEVVIPKVVDQKNPPLPGKQTVARRAIQSIIIDPKTGKILMLRWKKFPWTTFVTGGVEKDEDIITAARREILEESGYQNIKYVRTLGGPIESNFYAAHKGENRKALFSCLVFELENYDQAEISNQERGLHELVWLTWDEIANEKNLNCSEYEIWIDRLHNPDWVTTAVGVLINSGKFDGLDSEVASKAMALEFGQPKVQYKLRDWVFSRQRYWGEPIPLIHCDSCGVVPVPENQLPVTLPEIEKYEPTGTGQSPLAAIESWVNVKCPKCNQTAKRETNTMPQWAGSSWY